MIAVRAMRPAAPVAGRTTPRRTTGPAASGSGAPLGDAFGLSQFGVNLLELPPGTWSSQRHWHERQEELVYVLEGEVVLVTDEGETTLTQGMTAGFRAGTGNGHHLVNRSDRVARVIEVGTRTVEEVAHYPDIAMMFREDAAGWAYFTADGRPLK